MIETAVYIRLLPDSFFLEIPGRPGTLVQKSRRSLRAFPEPPDVGSCFKPVRASLTCHKVQQWQARLRVPVRVTSNVIQETTVEVWTRGIYSYRD
jgi:hypothetical protein